MALVQASSAASFVELDIGNSVESLGRLLDSQKELFHSQIDQFQKLVVAQCKLTGVNPLAQEMAAGALSIKIGKRPRDLLNPKAIKYMQSLFSIKDTLGKKETREISALCGVTVTQVREYFASQRSRVRKLVRVSREKATRSDASKLTSDGCDVSLGQSLVISKEASVNTVDLRTVGECTLVPADSAVLTTIQDGQQDPVKTDVKAIEEGPSCSSQEETGSGIDSHDKKFLEDIFNLMRKEESFSGQVKLMEWVLQIHNSAVLNWFLTKGGITILATWLSQAALEEQTTVLLVIFKVLCHLPLHKALPVQMSAILQTVNRLRFYRTSDISNRARILLSRWSKMFVRSQSLRNPSFMNSTRNAQKEIIRKRRISEFSDEPWQSRIDIPEDILALTESNDDARKLEPRRVLKLLPESSDGNRKHGRSVSSSKTKERRKVLLVEQPDRRSAGRNVQSARAVPSSHSRPMSADDIQKAKMRAIFMQNKHGKIDASAIENNKTKDNEVSPPPQTSLPPNSSLPEMPQLKADDLKTFPVPTPEFLPDKLETSIDPDSNSSSQEKLWEKLKRDQLHWQTPPEVKIDSSWRVGAGENSKEVQVQVQRIRREKEIFYPSPQDIPSDPKEPWDTEMDFDDSLTPEIPAEQPPEATDVATDIITGNAEGSLCSPHEQDGRATFENPPVATSSAPPPPTTSNCGPPAPDLELLAVLLKNPDLVFALTSGQGKNLTSDETVALLDMLKKSGVGLTGITNGTIDSSKEKHKEPEPTSLPSPTPPSDHSRNGWRSEFPSVARAPVLHPHFSGSREAAGLPAIPLQTAAPTADPMAFPSPTPATILSLPQLTVTVNPAPQPVPVHNFVPNRPPPHLPNQVTASMNPEATHIFPSTPALLHNPSRPQHQFMSEPPPTFPPTWLPLPPPPPAADTGVGRPEPMPDSWTSRPNGLLDVRAPNNRYPADRNSYGNNMWHRSQIGERSEIVGGSDQDSWGPEGSRVRSPEFRRGFLEPGRELGRIQHRPELSRQWSNNAGHRDRYRSSGGDKRRRDRDWERDRRR